MVIGRFLEDSVLIGDEVQYALTALVQARSVVVFPDSGANFGDFVLKNRKWFPQKPINGIGSLDSMVYTLTCFADPGYMFLTMPVLELLPNGDTTQHFAFIDSIYVHSHFPQEAASEELVFMPLAHEINYPYIIGGIFLALLLVIGLNLLLGRPIQRYWQLFLLSQRYGAYRKSYAKIRLNVLAKGHSADMEKLLNLWKNFIQRTSGEPYSTYTTKDIARLETSESLIQSLSIIDRWVYGGIVPEQKQGILDELNQYSTQAYQQKRQSIKHERKSV